jgi:NADH-quinone oxidoreductase subunit K
MIGLHAYLLLSALLFSIGLGGLVMRRNAVLMLSGQLLVLFAIVIAGAESSVGLALIIAIFRHVRSVHTGDLESLRG